MPAAAWSPPLEGRRPHVSGPFVSVGFLTSLQECGGWQPAPAQAPQQALPLYQEGHGAVPALAQGRDGDGQGDGGHHHAQAFPQPSVVAAGIQPGNLFLDLTFRLIRLGEKSLLEFRQGHERELIGVEPDLKIGALQGQQSLLKIVRAGGLLDGLANRLRPLGRSGLLLIGDGIGKPAEPPDRESLQGGRPVRSPGRPGLRAWQGPSGLVCSLASWGLR